MSNEPCDGRGDSCIGCADCNGRGSSKYKAMLDRVLNTVHRDSGQYTTLAGYETSVDEACKQVTNLRKKVTSLLWGASPRRKKNERTTP